MSVGTQSISGLVSGMDTANIIDQLMSIERQPIKNLETQIQDKQILLEAYRGVNSLLLEYSGAVQSAASRETWNTKEATSTNPGALSVESNEYSEPGTYNLRVGRLATAAQYTSAGFGDQKDSAVAPTAGGTISIDSGAASLAKSTKLQDLNGGGGVYHGSIRISQAGTTVSIDLTTAETLDDVITAINDATGVDVTASVKADGSGLQILDNAGTGVTVENVGLGTTADDLGLSSLTDIGGGVYEGEDVNQLSGISSLRMLNGGLGVNGGTLGTIEVVDDLGDTFTVDLSSAKTIQDVNDLINNEAGNTTVTAAISDNGRGLKLTGSGTITVTSDSTDGAHTTAEDLGLTALDGAGNGVDLLTDLNSTRIGSLMGQRLFNRDMILTDLGMAGGDTFTVTDKNGNAVTFTEGTDGTTIGELLDKLNDSTDTAEVLAYMDPENGNFVLGDITGDTTNDMTVSGTAAATLGFGVGNDNASAGVTGLQGTNIFQAGINGTADDASVDLGSLDITIGAATTTVDLTSLNAGDSLQDVLDALNAVDGNLTFSYNKSANGLQVTNATGQAVSIANNVGTTASDLGLTGSFTDGSTTDTGDIDKQYVSGATRLEKMNGGKGVSTGGMVITNSYGIYSAVDLSTAETVQDVVDTINDASVGVIASVNQTGDGITLTDTRGGSQPIIVSELGGGTTAKDLGLLGSGNGAVDGSQEKTIEVDTDDSLFDVMNKIADSGADVQVSIINDGSAYAPYRLVINSKNSGEAGDILMSSDIAAFNFKKNAEGLDSILLQGQPGSAVSPIMLKSSSNTNSNAILGLTMDMTDTTDNFVTVTVNENTEKAFQAVALVVDTFNNLQALVSEFDKWDSEAGEPGILFGDTAVRNMMDTVSEGFFSSVDNIDGGISMWFDIGLSFSQEGTLELDTSELRDALSSDFSAVRDLMTIQRDVARTDYSATASTSDTAAAGFEASGVINGNTDSKDFGNGNGFESTNAIGTGQSMTIDFGTARTLESLALYHVDSDTMPAKDYALRDFTIEYLDAMNNTWNTLREVRDNTRAATYLGFENPTKVRQIRINATDTNAADDKFRLLEVEAKETQGLAASNENVLDNITNFNTGFFAVQQEEISDSISDYEESIENLEKRMVLKETSLVNSFINMETALSQLTSQGDYFTAQMDALSGNKK